MSRIRARPDTRPARIRQPAPGWCPGPVRLVTVVGQEAAGDSLGLSTAGVDGLDSGLVVDTAGVDDAPGLLHAAIAPTSAKANRILLIMDFSSDCVPRAD